MPRFEIPGTYIRSETECVRAFAVSTGDAWASRSVRTSPQMPTLAARLRVSRAVHRRLLSASAPNASLQGLVVAATSPKILHE